MGGYFPWLFALGLAAALVVCLVAGLRARTSRQKLREQNLLFEATLSNMAQGLNVFDSIGRLVLCNDRYVEMYRLSRAAVKPGITVRQLIAMRVEAGTFFKVDPDEYADGLMTSILNRTPTQVELEVSDGRIINVISHPIQGGGWVVTHKDVTERSDAKREIEATRNFLQTVIEHVPTPIVVKDVRTRTYILVNRAAEQFHQLSRDQMIGKTVTEIFSAAGAATIAANDEQLLETRSIQSHAEHPIRVAQRRLPHCALDAAAGDGRRRHAANMSLP